MQFLAIGGFRPEKSEEGFEALVCRGIAKDGRVFVSVSADVATRIDAHPDDHVWSAEGSVWSGGSETVMSTACDLSLGEATAKAAAFLRRFAPLLQ
jgi:hypothetical protein